MPPIRQRLSLYALPSLYSFLKSPTLPQYLVSHFRFLCSNHERRLRLTNNLLLLCTSHISNVINSYFYMQSFLLWNPLPTEIIMSTNRFTSSKQISSTITTLVPVCIFYYFLILLWNLCINLSV